MTETKIVFNLIRCAAWKAHFAEKPCGISFYYMCLNVCTLSVKISVQKGLELVCIYSMEGSLHSDTCV